jgi:hypothetical protein
VTEGRVADSGSFTSRERRKQPRYAVNCRCWVEKESMTLFGTVTNLSAGGFFLRTIPIVTEGSDVEVRLSLENGIVTGRGAIRWCTQPAGIRADGPSAAPGMGIEFLQLSAGEELLESYIGRKSLVPEP